MFKTIGNAQHIIDKEIKLNIIGQRTFFEKAKMMFIEGEHSEMIYGMDTMGGEVGRWEDNAFLAPI